MAGLGIKLFTDEMINPRLATALRSQGYDVESCQEAGRSNRGLTDDDQPTYATRQGRAILTFNARDFRRLDARWKASGRTHAGIITSAHITDINELIRRVKLHLDTIRPDDQYNMRRLLAR